MSSNDQDFDVAAAVRAAMNTASPEARLLVTKVLGIEREHQHMALPRGVNKHVESAILEAVREGKARS